MTIEFRLESFYHSSAKVSLSAFLHSLKDSDEFCFVFVKEKKRRLKAIPVCSMTRDFKCFPPDLEEGDLKSSGMISSRAVSDEKNLGVTLVVGRGESLYAAN